MIVEKITSRQNPFIKRFRTVRQGQERHLILIEGIRLMEEAVSAELHFDAVAYTDQLLINERGQQLYQALMKLNCRGALVTAPIMEMLSEVEAPQGICALAHLPFTALNEVVRNAPPLLVIAHQLQDPGNIGTIARTGEAAGADGLIITPGTVNPYNVKALRASMGSAFRLPIVTNTHLAAIAELCQQHKITMVAADTRGTKQYTDFDWTRPIALLLGQEAEGLTEAAMAFVHEVVTIPMAAPVESLNVAAAATVLLYEAARQRKFQFNINKQP